MIARTHDLIGFTPLVYLIATQPLHQLTVATLAFGIGANLLGSSLPDLDAPTSDFWSKVPAGTIIGRLIHPLLGSHRMISHSLVGLVLVGWGLDKLLDYAKSFLLVDMHVIWLCFMLAYLFHLLADTVTKDGVPWFFPLPWKIGIPPFKIFRITTGAFVEKGVVFPGVLILNGYLIYQNYGNFIDFFRHYIVK